MSEAILRITPSLPKTFGGEVLFQRLVRDLGRGGVVSAGGLWGSSQALLFASATELLAGPWLVVTSTEPEAEALTADLDALGVACTYLPARETYSTGRARAPAHPRARGAPRARAGGRGGAPAGPAGGG
ncbi:MAG: hypothetical protein P1V81_11420, partial [Planctomycetota bacterium]|nr:hypothetical protein [Planctomycetota bacterium]